MTTKVFLFEMVLGNVFDNYSALFVALPGVPLNLVALHNGHASQFGTTTVRKAGAASEIEAVRRMYIHNPPPEQVKSLVVVCPVIIADTVNDLAYPYTFHTCYEAPAF